MCHYFLWHTNNNLQNYYTLIKSFVIINLDDTNKQELNYFICLQTCYIFFAAWQRRRKHHRHRSRDQSVALSNAGGLATLTFAVQRCGEKLTQIFLFDHIREKHILYIHNKLMYYF